MNNNKQISSVNYLLGKCSFSLLKYLLNTVEMLEFINASNNVIYKPQALLKRICLNCLLILFTSIRSIEPKKINTQTSMISANNCNPLLFENYATKLI